MTQSHSSFIDHCLKLAEQGRGFVGNGALVGSCLVRDGKVLAEGYHSAYGEAHAERILLENYEQKISTQDILYVNLEPCCHHGKTPPCTDIILEKGVKKLVFGMQDPDPRVAGEGIRILEAAGVQCIGPIDSAVCRRFNRGFVSVRENNRPWITLKSAKTADGRIANDDGSPLKITSEEQDAWSHEFLRAKHDAILVGVKTIIQDDPELTVRFCHPERSRRIQPMRVILDPHGRIPQDAKVLNDEYAEKTIVVTEQEVPLQGSDFSFDPLFDFLL